MEVLLVLTDSSSDCGKALEMLREVGEKFSAGKKVLVVLEDLYRLEKASVSLGLPIPKDTLPEAKRRITDRIRGIWRHLGGDEIHVEAVAGDLREEVLRKVNSEKVDMIIWGCEVNPSVCRAIDEVEIPSLIIK